MAGIGLRSLVTLNQTEILFLMVISFGLALIWRRGEVLPSAPYLLCASLFLLCAALGMLRMEITLWHASSGQYEQMTGTNVELQGMVAREVEYTASSAHVYVDVDGELVLATADSATPAAYGDIVRMQGRLEKPETFETELGRTFNYPGYLHARGVTYVLQFADVTALQSRMGNPLTQSLLDLKHAFTNRIERVLPFPHAGLSEGLLLGVKQALGETLEEDFRIAGVMHIVVLSGYNIMLVVLFVMYVLAWVLPLRARLLFGVVAIAAFALMVGLSATVLRASVMACLVLIARLTGRTYAVLRALMVTACAMLLFNPYLLLFDVGFQLSCIATLGLIVLSPYIEQHIRFMPAFLGLREFLTATLATQVFVTPLLLYQIGSFSVVSIVVNMLVLPMVPLSMLLTFITGMVGFISTQLSMYVGYFAYLSLAYIITVVQFFSGLPFASVSVPAFPPEVLIVLYGALFVVMLRLRISAASHADPLAGWTIVEEHTLATKTAAPLRGVAEVPIFFK